VFLLLRVAGLLPRNTSSHALSFPWIRSFWILALAIFHFACSAQTPTLTNAWSFAVRHFCSSSPAVADDGMIYFGLWNGDFRAFRPDGTPAWIFHAGREIHSSPAIGSNGTIYFGSRDRKLYAVGLDGKKKWDYKTGAWVDSSPAVGADGTIYFGSWDKNFYALKSDGAERWRFPTAGEIVSSPAIGLDGTIYFGSHDRKLHALRPDEGQSWEYATGGPIISSPAIDKDGTIYITSVDGFFYALGPHGVLKWRLRTGGITESSPVIGQDGTIYVGANALLWAISPDGQKKWTAQYGYNLIETAPLALEDGTVCFVSQFGLLINLGSPKVFNWIYDQTSYGSISPAIGKDGKIYTMGQVVGTGILLYALQTDAKLAQSSWPRFRGDPRGIGRVSQVP